MEPPLIQVTGEEMYSDSLKTYVISRGKMARIGLKKPTGDEELLEFFKAHADTVMNDPKDVPVEKLDLTSTTEQK
jgi:hypothetical protein